MGSGGCIGPDCIAYDLGRPVSTVFVIDGRFVLSHLGVILEELMKTLLLCVIGGMSGLLGFPIAGWADEAGPPPGEYNCYVYVPKAVHVGKFTMKKDGTYQAKEAGGRYRFDPKTDTLTWDGAPLLGFEVGVLELSPGATPQIRLYRTAAEIGKKWKAAVCSLKKD